MLTQSYLKSILNYDPSTGVFTWINSARYGWNGKAINCKNSRGYIETNINRKSYKLHRLVYLYMTGAFPTGEIDHIDGDKTNNRFDNLRITNRLGNTKNTKTPCTNNTGIKGVYFHKINKTWIGQITSDGKQYYLGSFATKSEAELAVRRKRVELHGEFANHG